MVVCVFNTLYMLLYHKTVILSIVNGPSIISQLLGFHVGKTMPRFLSVTVVGTRTANGNSSNATLLGNYVSPTNNIPVNLEDTRFLLSHTKDQLVCKTSK